MKNLIIALLTSLFSFCVSAECVEEFDILGQSLKHMKSKALYVDVHADGRFSPLHEVEASLNPLINYRVQRLQNASPENNYDNRYIQYYRYERLLNFLSEINQTLEQNNYITSTVGKSLDGRNLKAIYPREFDPNKKLIVMFGRHHGDEGTANWIIEGFVNAFFDRGEISEKYQLVLYPMVNPDGAERRVRYNRNRYDLNRVWAANALQSKDEVKFIHQHLNSLVIEKNLTPVITLDMHGSFTEDFIYRVGQSTFGQAYYQMQQLFIDELGTRDSWQAGNYILSEGEAGMARIRLAKQHGWHVLTHETPRDIPLSNRQNRSKQSLIEQGIAALETIHLLY